MFSSTFCYEKHGAYGRPRASQKGRGPNDRRAALATGMHVAIIMDGNGRWAQKRHRPRAVGHLAGAAAVRRTVEAAPNLGITTLTLYAFSADNWKRPPAEVEHLMRLFHHHLRSECEPLVESGARLSVIGRRDRLPRKLVGAIEEVEARTASGTRLNLRIAIDYSARHAIMAAAALLSQVGPTSREDFDTALARAMNAPSGTPEVDLLIRTGGERRLSDFLLWESAYAELIFTDTAWPDFSARDLESAVHEFSGRQRRFGGLGSGIPGPSSRSRTEGGVKG